MEILTVNAAIKQLDELLGSEIAVFGQLSLDFEHHCISHLPRAQRLPESDSGMEASSIWTRFDMEAIGQNEQWLSQFDTRHVVLRGTLYGPESGLDGCGHFGLWPAEIVVRCLSKP